MNKNIPIKVEDIAMRCNKRGYNRLNRLKEWHFDLVNNKVEINMDAKKDELIKALESGASIGELKDLLMKGD